MQEEKKENSNLSIELSEKLSLLLKYDWERAKNEAKPVYFRKSVFFGWGKLKRTSYEKYKHKRNSDNS